jgi:hypothetical protein
MKFIQSNRHTSIILVTIPHRYDLPYWSCVNSEIETFSKKLKESMRPFTHVKIVKVEQLREYFTKHGQHMSKVGKENIVKKIAQAVINIGYKQSRELISLYWKTEHMIRGKLESRDGMPNTQVDLKEIIVDGKVTESNGVTCEKVNGEVTASNEVTCVNGEVEAYKKVTSEKVNGEGEEINEVTCEIS